MREARDLVFNVINCAKPIVSAIHGPAVGAGLVAGLLADVSVVGAHGPHHRRPHPARRGGRRPRRHLLAAAVRHGQGEVLPVDLRHADRRGGRAHRAGVAVRRRRRWCRTGRWTWPSQLAGGAQSAIRWTKQTLNNWYRAQSAVLDASLAYEFYGFGGPDAARGPRLPHRATRAPVHRPDVRVTGRDVPRWGRDVLGRDHDRPTGTVVVAGGGDGRRGAGRRADRRRVALVPQRGHHRPRGRPRRRRAGHRAAAHRHPAPLRHVRPHPVGGAPVGAGHGHDRGGRLRQPVAGGPGRGGAAGRGPGHRDAVGRGSWFWPGCWS